MKKTFVVNGSAHPGFGETTARVIIDSGHKVIGLYEKTDIKNADLMRSEFNNNSLQLIEFNNRLEEVENLMKQIPEDIDGFVNACFLFEMENVEKFDIQLPNMIFEANYHVPITLAIALKQKMKNGSSIVIISSTESERGSFGGLSYAASKAAISNAIKTLACNWGRNNNIRVNAIAAGWIGGEMDTDGPFAVSMDITPLGRLGKPEEIAQTVDFLLSEKASFINAQTIIVDGGYLAVDNIAKFEFLES